MLGNFSFGDYFKKEAIAWSWEYITTILKLDPKRLYVSVYLTDDEAYNIWVNEIGIPEDHMVRLGDDDNWWAAGPIGSCGPCSEIYYDTLNMGPNNEEINSKPGDEGNRFLEIWNLVFTEWNRLEDGSLIPLPEKNIDTGAGLERIASVVQNKDNNFETDLFTPITKKINEILEIKSEKTKTAVKIIADHLRASTFLICDGVLPSNEGRGYILKKLIRRAYGAGALENQKIFNNSETYLYKIVDTIIDNMKEAYPELEEKREYIKNIVKNEEDKFSKTLKIGTDILFEAIENGKDKKISSDLSFKLYDTYGFPFEFTKLIAESKGFIVDEDEFNEKLEEQVKRSQNSRNSVSDMIKDEFIGKFYEEHGKTHFIGYDTLKSYCKLLHIKENGDNLFEAIFEETPFYAESGGQVSDKGIIKNKNGFVGEIVNIVKKSDIFIHYFKLIEGNIPTVNSEVKLIVDEQHRLEVMKNHTATHLLHKALREVLGKTVEQAGSLVNAEGLRFDFSYYNQITEDELKKIESMVNDAILKNLPVFINYENINEAKERGAMALFSDKYGDIVRVVDISDYSVELCGGTHVRSTGEIGLFKILSEQGKASGVRRIEAITGHKSLEYVNNLENLINNISSSFKTSPSNVETAVSKAREELKEKDNLIKELQSKIAKLEVSELVNEAYTVNGVKVLIKKFKNKSIDELKELIDMAKVNLESAVILFASSNDNAIFVSGVTKDLTNKFNAGNIVKLASSLTDGKGGGRPDFAQAGGKDVSKIDIAINEVKKYIEEQ